MNFQEARKIVNKAIYEKEGRGLSDAEVVVLKGSWENMTYEEMAEISPYTANYLKGDMGHKFWKLLSEALGESVGKRNFKAALERARSRFLVEDPRPTWLEVPDEKQWQKKESTTWRGLLESDESPKEVHSQIESSSTKEKRKMWQIVFELDDKRKVSPIIFELEDIDDLGEIVKQLEKLGEGSMTVKRIEKGSIVLTVETDPECYERINYLFNSGLLKEVLGNRLLHILRPFPDELCLKFSELELDGAWSLKSDYSNERARLNAYFNKLCFNKLATWLNVYKLQNRAILPAIWEVANGSVIEMGKRRLVLIPCQGAKADELCVPQEWIDIPNWTGNYYLAVRVSLAEMRIWGYATHRQLKNEGTYDPNGRTYSLGADNLGKLSQIWEVPIVHTKAALDPLPNLSGKVTNLSGWFQGLIEAGWQTIEEIIETFRQMPEPYDYGVRTPVSATAPGTVRRGKIIYLGTPTAGTQVVLVITLMPEANEETKVHLRLSPAGQTYLPPNLQLGVFIETGEIVLEARSRNADNWIQLEFIGDRSDAFSVKVALGEASVTEKFAI
ncbi:MAG: DUF1822 family protein [Cyanobacteriota bacterium]|nr:DUF1822 family protein [Cyanobacteriota bacterium]